MRGLRSRKPIGFRQWVVHTDQHKCINCGKCKKTCKMEVDPVANPGSAECIRCGECVQACPEKALYLGFKTYNKKAAMPDKKYK